MTEQSTDNAPPTALTLPQVKEEAHKLEGIADQWLSGGDATALKAWQDELKTVPTDSARQVFQQIKADSTGNNPLLPNVRIGGSLDPRDTGISLNTSTLSNLAHMSKRSLSSDVSVGSREVSTTIEQKSVLQHTQNPAADIMVHKEQSDKIH